MSLDADINTIHAILSAWPKDVLKAAFKQWAINNYKIAKDDGWITCVGKCPPKEGEWMLVNGVYFVRDYDPSRYEPGPQRQIAKAITQCDAKRKIICPWCGEEAFPQVVCSKCAKGKAGIKTQYLCGSGDPSHIFYVE